MGDNFEGLLVIAVILVGDICIISLLKLLFGSHLNSGLTIPLPI